MGFLGSLKQKAEGWAEKRKEENREKDIYNSQLRQKYNTAYKETYAKNIAKVAKQRARLEARNYGAPKPNGATGFLTGGVNRLGTASTDLFAMPTISNKPSQQIIYVEQKTRSKSHRSAGVRVPSYPSAQPRKQRLIDMSF